LSPGLLFLVSEGDVCIICGEQPLAIDFDDVEEAVDFLDSITL
jgi:hypothetical protein